jgi:hypothetical protein
LIRLTISSPSRDPVVAPLAAFVSLMPFQVARFDRRFSMGGRAF